MAAYAALVSLMNIIDDIQHHHSPPISLDKQQLQSLAEIVAFLQEFLEGYNSPVADSDEADPLEMRIADAAYAAEDVIETYIVDNIKLVAKTTHHDDDDVDDDDGDDDDEDDDDDDDDDDDESNIVEKIQPSRSKETKFSLFFNCFRGPKKPKNVPSVDANHDDEQIKCTTLYQELQQVVEDMDLIKKELMETDLEKAVVQDQRHRFVPAFVSSLRSSSKSSMVCPDGVILGIMGKLVAEERNRVVIPIVGMGGIVELCIESVVVSAKRIVEEQEDLYGEQLDLHIKAILGKEVEALQSLASPNFEVEVRDRFTYYLISL